MFPRHVFIILAFTLCFVAASPIMANTESALIERVAKHTEQPAQTLIDVVEDIHLEVTSSPLALHRNGSKSFLDLFLKYSTQSPPKSSSHSSAPPRRRFSARVARRRHP